MDLDDAILLLRDPNLTEWGLILAAKLAARELGPVRNRTAAAFGTRTGSPATRSGWRSGGSSEKGSIGSVERSGRIQDLSRVNVLGYG
jgi:hypothetical protein